MRIRLMLWGFALLVGSLSGCSGKKKGPYFAPQPARMSVDASSLRVGAVLLV